MKKEKKHLYIRWCEQGGLGWYTYEYKNYNDFLIHIFNRGVGTRYCWICGVWVNENRIYKSIQRLCDIKEDLEILINAEMK